MNRGQKAKDTIPANPDICLNRLQIFDAFQLTIHVYMVLFVHALKSGVSVVR